MQECKFLKCATALLLSLTMSLPLLAQEKKDAAKPGDKQPAEADMMAMMMEMAKPGENHKLLAKSVGKWSYIIKYWMDPAAPAMESSGTAVTKEILDGRFFLSESEGKMQMPGPDGKMMDMAFKGIGINGYDNAKKKFVSSWVDSMGTGIMMSEGTYDPATKKLTYHADYEMMPGMKTKIREILTFVDNDHYTFEFFEDRGATEAKTMEIKYTRMR